MRILQLHARYRIAAGEDSVVENEAATLRRHGHDVHQVIADNPTSSGAAVRALARSLHNRPVAHRVRAEIDAFRPDVVHVHNTWFALTSSAISAAAASGVPVVMTVHNYRLGCLSADLFRNGDVCTACVGRLPVAGVFHGCYRGSRLLSAVEATEIATTRTRGVLDRSITRFVAPSTFMADRLIDIGLPRHRLVVKPHFVSDPGPRSASPSGSPEVLSIGRLAAGKGLETLVAACAATSGPPDDPLRLAILGDGPLRDQLRPTPAGMPVDFDGWLARDEVSARMLGARALVMPSEWYEPFGMVLIEAMAAGLPIIVSTAAGGRDIVAPPSELVVAPGDPAELSAALGRLSGPLADEVGARNRARYEARYSEAAGIAALTSLYEETIGAFRA